ncbi:MAG: hypothetical protein JWM80_83 [Cyanobacteria bacterium RYN_339]|nr:hypothetical protein [Cyanobacteria bacterium RYN_339]
MGVNDRPVQAAIKVFKAFPAECALWVVLSAGAGTITAMLSDGLEAVVWGLVGNLVELYLVVAATWLGLGQSSFRRTGWRELWRVTVAGASVLVVLIPIGVAVSVGWGVAEWQAWAPKKPTIDGAGYLVIAPLLAAVSYALVRFSYAPFLILDREARAGDAILGSLALTRGQVGPLIGLVVLPILVAGVAFVAIKPLAMYFVARLATDVLVLAGLIALGLRYRSTPEKERRGSLVHDPLTAILLALCLATIPLAALLANR